MIDISFSNDRFGFMKPSLVLLKRGPWTMRLLTVGKLRNRRNKPTQMFAETRRISDGYITHQPH